MENIVDEAGGGSTKATNDHTLISSHRLRGGGQPPLARYRQTCEP